MKQSYYDVLYHPLSPLVIQSLIWAVINVIYLNMGRAPSTAFETVASLCWAFLLLY
jgi:hypothetical protein